MTIEDQVGELRGDLDDIRALIEQVERRRSSNVGTSVAQVNVNAGGLGVALCTLCCAVMLTAGGVYAYMSNQATEREVARQLAKDAEQDAKISTTGDYLQAIYAQAPQLKPKEADQ